MLAPATAPPIVDAAFDALQATDHAERSTSKARLMVGAAAGARLSFPNDTVGPVLLLRPAGTLGHWELALTGELEPTCAYFQGSAPPGFSEWSAAGRGEAGRRESIGKLGLGYALGFGVTAGHEAMTDASGNTQTVQYVQPRGSLLGHLTLPRGARWRATLDIGIDVAFLTSMSSTAPRTDAPARVPRWGTLLCAGVEASVL